MQFCNALNKPTLLDLATRGPNLMQSSSASIALGCIAMGCVLHPVLVEQLQRPPQGMQIFASLPQGCISAEKLDRIGPLVLFSRQFLSTPAEFCGTLFEL